MCSGRRNEHTSQDNPARSQCAATHLPSAPLQYGPRQEVPLLRINRGQQSLSPLEAPSLAGASINGEFPAWYSLRQTENRRSGTKANDAPVTTAQ